MQGPLERGVGFYESMDQVTDLEIQQMLRVLQRRAQQDRELREQQRREQEQLSKPR